MSRKPKHHTPPRLTVADTKARVNKAVREGRFQQALELAKQLQKQEPTAEHAELLRTTYLGRARQLRSQGYTRDAVTVLQAALLHGGQDVAWLGHVAQELAACGQVRQALDMLKGQPESPAHAQVLAHAADTALQQEAAGRALLPPVLHADFDRILTACAQLEAGQDEQAKETLQGISLRSPFLEWKVLLRGLLAYYQKDDVRALENWQRLNSERLPARLAAPLRFAIDSAYRTAQPPATQTVLQKQADRFQGSTLAQQLRAVQAALATGKSLANAFRQAEILLPLLRQEAPHLVTRLAACFYWTIIMSGQPEDVPRYQRVFGTPADDPKFDRLNALACEHVHDLPEAHRHWQQYEKGVSANPTVWPGDQANRVRALIWCRMGNNAASVPDPDKIPDLPPFLRDHPDRPRPLVPNAEKCFQRSLELAPDQLDAYEALFEYHQGQNDHAKVEIAARQLLEHFPDHVATLEALADLLMEQRDYGEALTLFQRALKTNPLDRRLRGKISSAHTFHARTHAEAGRFDEARAEYQASLTFSESKNDSSVLCKWAACEFKADNPERAEELLQQALAQEGNHLAVAFSMLIEIIRLKLPGKLKTRFDREFNTALAEPPTGAGAAAIVRTAAAHRLAGVDYRGQKTHEKKVLTYLDKAVKADFTEDQLEKVCGSLLSMKNLRLARTFTGLGRKRFPKSPVFPYLEAESYIAEGPARCPIWQVGPLLEEASRLAAKLPADDRQQQLLDAIRARQQMISLFNPFSGSFMEQLGDMFGGMLDDDDDEDDLDDDW